MKYFFIAGEQSGDFHGSTLMHELKIIDDKYKFVFFGGDLMRAEAGVRPIRHIREMSFMGFWVVFKNMFKILDNLKVCKAAILKEKPDAVVLIDYPGFNLRIAKFVRKQLGIPVYYYISPSVWAWKSHRVKNIKRDVTKLFSIIPFEKDFYAKYNCEIQYVGNPSVDAIHENLDLSESREDYQKKFFLNDKPILALLPGSRKQEIAACLSKMIKAASHFTDYQIVISGVTSISTEFYYKHMFGQNYTIIKHHPYQLLYHADAAIVNSGTATLETALIGTPQVVIYHVMLGRLAYWAKNIFLKTKYISLVNILSQKEVVKELYAHLFTVDNLKKELSNLLNNEKYREKMTASYDTLKEQLGEPGTAKRTATSIYNDLFAKK